jgi:hypothetical protein
MQSFTSPQLIGKVRRKSLTGIRANALAHAPRGDESLGQCRAISNATG